MSGLVTVSVFELELICDFLRNAESEAQRKVITFTPDRFDEIYKYFYDEAVCNRNNLHDALAYVEHIIREAKKNPILEEE